MPDVQIYKLDLTAGDISVPTNFRTVFAGGSDAPMAGYPEISIAERIQRNENAGALGQHVLDENGNGYSVCGVFLSNMGNLASGQYDTRGGGAGHPLKCRWRQFFSSVALNEAGYCQPIGFAHGGTTPASSPGIFTTNLF